MGNEFSKPYVISSDLHGLMKRWSVLSGYSLPHESFFESIGRDLESLLRTYYEGNVEVISELELTSGLETLAAKSEYPIISLDRAYIESDTSNVVGFLDVTRAVDENMEDIGMFPRPGYSSIDIQLEAICQGSGPLALLDDVVVSGKGICDLALELGKRGRPVKQIIAGVAISEGIERARSLGIEVQAIREYKDVIDEVCERDYYAGVPMSGRSVIATTGETGSAPYFQPFGNPRKWASIPPERVPEFSSFCLTQSLILWGAVETHSQTNVPVGVIPRKIFGIPEDISIVNVLKGYLSKK